LRQVTRATKGAAAGGARKEKNTMQEFYFKKRHLQRQRVARKVRGRAQWALWSRLTAAASLLIHGTVPARKGARAHEC
jgi:hypothetical protein